MVPEENENLEKLLGEITNKARLLARESYVEATVYNKMRGHRPKKDGMKKARLVWKQVLGSEDC